MYVIMCQACSAFHFYQLKFFLCSPDYVVSGPDRSLIYKIELRPQEDCDDLIGLNPQKKYPHGKDVRHLGGEKRKAALNTIRQRRHQRKRQFKTRW